MLDELLDNDVDRAGHLLFAGTLKAGKGDCGAWSTETDRDRKSGRVEGAFFIEHVGAGEQGALGEESALDLRAFKCLQPREAAEPLAAGGYLTARKGSVE